MSESILNQLDAKIPREVIKTRKGENGRMLDYLSGDYVIDRLNKVLGAGNWAYASEASLVHQGTISSRDGDTHSVHYLAKVRLVVTLGDKPTEFHDYGYGDGTNKTNPGKAHELAVKEAVTDGLKRCAKNLGMSFGLALYSKEQENVDEGEKEVRTSAPKPTVNQTPSKPAFPKTNPVGGVRKEPAAAVPKESTREVLLKKISATSKVIVDSKRDSQDNLLKMLDVFGVKRKEELDETQAVKLLGQLEEKLR